MQHINIYLETAISAAKQAGEALRKRRTGFVDIKQKGEIDFVTEMDIESEKIITDIISQKFPSHSIIAEEEDAKKRDSEYAWYIDPLDGTTNYSRKLPWYAVSIGLFRSGAPYAGVIYNPENEELFFAADGDGAFLNNQKINVSKRYSLGEALLSTGFPYYIRHKSDRVKSNFNKFLPVAVGIRRFGAASLDLAYVAAGRYDGFWEEGLKSWDTAAGLAILKEAGGIATDYSGNPYNFTHDTICAANVRLSEEMLKILGS